MFYPSKRYQEKYEEDSSDNLVVAEARISEEPLQRRGVDKESLQLLFQAFVNNFIYRPMKSLGNFFIVTSTIISDPSAGIGEKYLIT